MGVPEHRARAADHSTVRVAIISVSDTRTRETDEGGAVVEALTREAGFSIVGRDLIPDETETIRSRVAALAGSATTERLPSAAGAISADDGVDVILLTGGTGLAPRDRTVDAIAPLFERRLDGFGELFRMLSFAEIGAAAMLSRAGAGVLAGGVAVFMIPGSPSAIRLALGRLILPELGHLVAELRRSASPASFASEPGHEHHDGHHARHQR